MEEFRDLEILKKMFTYMKDYDIIIMSVVGAMLGTEDVGLGVRLDGWKYNDPNAYWMESIASHHGLFNVNEVPQVIEYKRLLGQRRKDKINKLLTL